jgi:hypothetical protein
MPRLCKLRLAPGGTVPLNGQFEVIEPLTRQKVCTTLATRQYRRACPPFSRRGTRGSRLTTLQACKRQLQTPFTIQKLCLSQDPHLSFYLPHRLWPTFNSHYSEGSSARPSIIHHVAGKTRCLASGLAACCSHSQRSGKDVSVFQLSVPFPSPPFP